MNINSEKCTIKGELFDVLYKNDRTVETINQGHNMIVTGCHEIVARLINGDLKDQPHHIFYFQCGADKTTPVASDTKIKELVSSKKCTVKKNGTAIEFTATFDDEDEGNGKTWYECGILMLVGHEKATGEDTTGKTIEVVDGKDVVIEDSILLNRKVTNYPIIKDNSFSIARTFRITF